jgi:hypothetical protein
MVILVMLQGNRHLIWEDLWKEWLNRFLKIHQGCVILTLRGLGVLPLMYVVSSCQEYILNLWVLLFRSKLMLRSYHQTYNNLDIKSMNSMNMYNGLRMIETIISTWEMVEKLTSSLDFYKLYLQFSKGVILLTSNFQTMDCKSNRRCSTKILVNFLILYLRS